MADELLLLAVVSGKWRIRIRAGKGLRFALRAAELAELRRAGRIAVGPRWIEVVDSRRVEDRRLSNVLHSLGTAPGPASLQGWLRRAPRSLVIEYLSRLEDQKAVRVRRRRDPSGRTRHDIRSVDLPRRRALLLRLDNVVRAGSAASPDDRDLTLAVLAQAAGLARAVYPGLRGVTGRRRMAALAATDLPAAEAGAGLVAAEEPSGVLATSSGFNHRLYAQLSNIYSDVTTGGHGLGHDLNSASWADGDASGFGDSGGGHGDGGHGGW